MDCLRCSIDTDIPSLDYRYQAMVDYRGSVHWVPAAKLRTFCQIDMRRFPFDEQRFLVLSVLSRCWLGGRKGIRPVKNWSGGVLAWLSVWSEV